MINIKVTFNCNITEIEGKEPSEKEIFKLIAFYFGHTNCISRKNPLRNSREFKIENIHIERNK